MDIPIRIEALGSGSMLRALPSIAGYYQQSVIRNVSFNLDFNLLSGNNQDLGIWSSRNKSSVQKPVLFFSVSVRTTRALDPAIVQFGSVPLPGANRQGII